MSSWAHVRHAGSVIGRAPVLATMAVLLASTALGTTGARAVDGTWVGNHAGDPNEWVEPANWSANAIPDGTATFTNNGAPVTVDANGVVIGGIIFTGGAANAPAYTITMDDIFNVTGAGVSNNSTNTQTFNITSQTAVFENSSSASGGTTPVTYNNTFIISFTSSSTAGNAIINNNGNLEFNDNSNAGTAQITNNATLSFNNNSSASGATIGNASGQVINFFNTSTAGTATITNNGT